MAGGKSGRWNRCMQFKPDQLHPKSNIALSGGKHHEKRWMDQPRCRPLVKPARGTTGNERGQYTCPRHDRHARVTLAIVATRMRRHSAAHQRPIAHDHGPTNSTAFQYRSGTGETRMAMEPRHDVATQCDISSHYGSGSGTRQPGRHGAELTDRQSSTFWTCASGIDEHLGRIGQPSQHDAMWKCQSGPPGPAPMKLTNFGNSPPFKALPGYPPTMLPAATPLATADDTTQQLAAQPMHGAAPIQPANFENLADLYAAPVDPWEVPTAAPGLTAERLELLHPTDTPGAEDRSPPPPPSGTPPSDNGYPPPPAGVVPTEHETTPPPPRSPPPPNTCPITEAHIPLRHAPPPPGEYPVEERPVMAPVTSTEACSSNKVPVYGRRPPRTEVNLSRAKPGEMVGNYYCRVCKKSWLMMGVDRRDKSILIIFCKNPNGSKTIGDITEQEPLRATEGHWARVILELAVKDVTNLVELVKEEVALQQEKPGGIASPEGIDHLAIPPTAKLDAWQHGSIFPEHQGCLWYPCTKCLQWTGNALASASCTFIQCKNPNCLHTICATPPGEDVMVKAERQRLRLRLLQVLPPWRVCGESKYSPVNGPTGNLNVGQALTQNGREPVGFKKPDFNRMEVSGVAVSTMPTALRKRARLFLILTLKDDEA